MLFFASCLILGGLDMFGWCFCLGFFVYKVFGLVYLSCLVCLFCLVCCLCLVVLGLICLVACADPIMLINK